MRILFICIFVALFATSAYALDYFDYQTLDLNLKIQNTMEIEEKASKSFTDYVHANLSYFPRNDYRQQVKSLTTIPAAEQEETINFIWNNPPKSIMFTVESSIATNAEFKQVKQKTAFPINNLDGNFAPYLEEGEIIDSDPDITNLAASLAEGKDDLYSVVFALADWTNTNIEYNLSTSNVAASKKASWVLKNRQGVCDELTSLFISMNRALGIPARFVSGIAYTNVASFGEPWGAHGWAEVYFPNVGWVPFDVTYGQYGYVDAGHIKLRESPESGISSVNYEYRGYNIDLETGNLDFQTTVEKTGNPIEKVFDIELSMYKSSVGFGSYNVVIADIQNLKNYYVAEEIFLGQTTKLQQIHPAKKNILLKPNERKKFYWIIKVDTDLENRFTYTFPVKVYTDRKEEATTSFTSANGFGMVPYEEIAKYQETEVKEHAVFSCSADSTAKLNEPVEMLCTFDKQNKVVTSIDICLEGCKRYTLMQEETSITFNKTFNQTGLQTITISAKNNEFSRTAYVIINVVDEPSLSVEVDVPENVSFDDTINMLFSISKDSFANPEKVKVSIKHSIIHYSWNFDVLDKNQQITFSTPAKNLESGENKFILDIVYEDDLGNIYTEKKEFSITLQDTHFGQKLYITGNKIGSKIEQAIINPEARMQFFKSPKTWIVFIVIILILVSIKIIAKILLKKKSI
ncbi:transglutaminase domain-containing protein [Candidatus Woesearchaeota archaeon]|nr:MAG: transglutaminase domain-containing protein [Candidatus Woesearchaeota archaeon]